MKQKITELATIFHPYNTLFAVGGCVRNTLLGLSFSDIDLTSANKPEEVEKILANTDYITKIVNKKLGTILIKKGDLEFEHTTFRKENYPKGGVHTPEQTSFVTDISVDASRRDFTMNAIYYDVLKGNYYDPYNGRKDAKRRILRAIPPEDKTFFDDGLRIFRMVKFATSLRLKIAKQTLLSAEKNITNLQAISSERIVKEINQIIKGNSHYNIKHNKNCAVRAVKILQNINAFSQIFPDLKIKNNIKWESLKSCKENPLIAFYVDLYMNCLDDNIDNFLENTVIKLKYDNNTKNFLKKILTGYQNLTTDLSTENSLKYFEYLLPIANYVKKYNKKLAKNLCEIYNSKTILNAPTNYGMLKISVEKLKSELNLENNQIGEVLDYLLLSAFENPAINTNEKLVELAKQKEKKWN